MRLAAHDLGSNSFHTVVVDVHEDGTFHELAREKEMLRLGDVVARHGRLTPESVSRSIDALRRLRALAEAAGAEEHVACATSALREASNGPEAVEQLEAATGIRVRVISGKDEAKLIFSAVRASVAIDPAPALCLDLGGGSLEISVGDHAGMQWCTSLRLGVGRLAAELSATPGETDRFSKGDQKALRDRLVAAFAPAALAIEDLAPRMMVVTSGTFLDLVRLVFISTGQPVPLSINNARVSRRDLQAVHRRLIGATPAQRLQMPGVDARRGDVMHLGSMVLSVALDVFGLGGVTAGEWALREGIVLDAISHHDPADWSGDPSAVRRASVLALCRRCNWNASHSRHVAFLALSMFDQTVALHGLGASDRELLEYAALLHDVGEHVSGTSHHKHTSYLVQHGGLRGFAPEEVAAVAALARYHRRSEPKADHELFASLPADWQRRVTQLAGFLRVADGLDRGHVGAVGDVRTEIGRTSVRFVVEPVAGDGSVELEVWGGRRKSALLAKVLQREVDVAEGV